MANQENTTDVGMVPSSAPGAGRVDAPTSEALVVRHIVANHPTSPLGLPDDVLDAINSVTLADWARFYLERGSEAVPARVGAEAAWWRCVGVLGDAGTD